MINGPKERADDRQDVTPAPGRSGGPGRTQNLREGDDDHAPSGQKLMEAETGMVLRLAAAALDPDYGRACTLVAQLRAEGLSCEALTDRIIPAAAQMFGTAWCEDKHSFTDVTVGAARLQSLVRELTPPPPGPFDLEAPEILLILPEENQHTLGALIAAAQFRRHGALITLSLGEPRSAISRMVRGRRHDMVAISAPSVSDLESLSDLVNILRTGAPPPPPIVLGGGILSLGEDALTRIGADFATCDPKEALELCGLSKSLSTSTQPSRMRGPPDRVPEKA